MTQVPKDRARAGTRASEEGWGRERDLAVVSSHGRQGEFSKIEYHESWLLNVCIEMDPSGGLLPPASASCSGENREPKITVTEKDGN